MIKNDKQLLMNQLQVLAKLYAQGSLVEAAQQGEILAQNFPQSPTLKNLLGAVYAGLGQYDAAEKNFEKAIALKPDYAEAYNNLGSLQFSKHNYDAAIENYGRAVEIKPDYVDAHRNMGNTLLARSHFPAALKCFRDAIRLNPDNLELHVGLGAVLQACGNPAGAVASYRKVLDIQPHHVAALVNMGVAQQALGDNKAAIENYRHALTIRSDHAEAHNNLGSALREEGNFKEALFHGQEAVRFKPSYAGAYRNLSLISKCVPGDERIERMRALAKTENLLDKDRCQLCFALGKAYEDIGDAAEAFVWLERGNALRKQELRYDIAADRRLFEQIKKTFSGEVPELPTRESGKNPVFIIGMPRSGTTLVEQILSSHSGVYGAGELALMGKSVGVSGWPAHAPNIEMLTQMRQHYLAGLQELNADEPYVIDKMPINFRWVGFILLALPEAKIIHMKRDSRATCWSIFKQYFTSSGNGYAYDLNDIVAYYRLYADLMSFWHGRYPGRIYDLSYEALTEDQETQTRKLLEHIGLAWEDKCLAFYENKRVVKTASALQVRQKMYSGSSAKWEKYVEMLGAAFEELKGV